MLLASAFMIGFLPKGVTSRGVRANETSRPAFDKKKPAFTQRFQQTSICTIQRCERIVIVTCLMGCNVEHRVRARDFALSVEQACGRPSLKSGPVELQPLHLDAVRKLGQKRIRKFASLGFRSDPGSQQRV